VIVAAALAVALIVVIGEALRRDLKKPYVGIHYSSVLASGFNAKAFVFGRHVFVAGPDIDSRDLNHERTHVEQFWRYGYIGFFARYLWYQVTVGYVDNPLEKEARMGEFRYGPR